MRSEKIPARPITLMPTKIPAGLVVSCFKTKHVIYNQNQIYYHTRTFTFHRIKVLRTTKIYQFLIFKFRVLMLDVSCSFVNVILGIALAVLLSPSIMAENKAELQVVQGNNIFTTKLYNVLAAQGGNVFFSPISIHAVLSMAYQGAQGTTAEKMAAALQLPEASLAAQGYNAVMSRLNSVENVTLLMANKVYLMEGNELLTDFSTAVTKHFLSEVQLLNFAKNEEAAKSINAWVEDKTREKIKDLIQKDDLNELTRLVLVNAIYFKGNWKHKFDPEATKLEPFFLNDVDKVDVQMMHIKKEFFYKNDEQLDAQILELPYTNEDLSMIIILPNKITGITELEKKLENTNLTELTQGMWKTDVNVALPRFKIEQTIQLNDVLKKLGLEEMFSEDKANFRGMITLKPNENLYVSKVVQKAFIEVNEEGAEAAAATGMIMMMRCSLPLPPRQFTADHPFFYILSDKRTNQLFTGRLANPNL